MVPLLYSLDFIEMVVNESLSFSVPLFGLSSPNSPYAIRHSSYSFLSTNRAHAQIRRAIFEATWANHIHSIRPNKSHILAFQEQRGCVPRFWNELDFFLCREIEAIE